MHYWFMSNRNPSWVPIWDFISMSEEGKEVIKAKEEEKNY